MPSGLTVPTLLTDRMRLWKEGVRALVMERCCGHCQLIEKIPNKWLKHWTTDLLTPCIVVRECQGKSQEIG